MCKHGQVVEAVVVVSHIAVSHIAVVVVSHIALVCTAVNVYLIKQMPAVHISTKW